MRAKAAMVVIGALAIACGMPSDKSVRADFSREHPHCQVLAVYSGEGDSDTVYKHIRFRSGSVDCEVEWGYQRAESEWRVFSRGKAQPSETACACREAGP
jgi:hypothetical protein